MVQKLPVVSTSLLRQKRVLLSSWLIIPDCLPERGLWNFLSSAFGTVRHAHGACRGKLGPMGVGASIQDDQGTELSMVVLSPREILPLRLTSHPPSDIVRNKALLRSFRGVAFIC